ncbi:hypothetical protein ACQ4PT_023525 [Festuca glaucescens]
MTVARRSASRSPPCHSPRAGPSPLQEERLCFSGVSAASSDPRASPTSPTYAAITAHQPRPASPSPSRSSASPAPASPPHAPTAPRHAPSVRSIIVVPEETRLPAPQVSSDWQEVRSRHGRSHSSLPRSDAGITASQPPTHRSFAVAAFKEELRFRCFRCFDHKHHVRHCKNQARCIHCLDAGHLAKGCPTSHLPRVPLPPLPDKCRSTPKPPVHIRLVFPPDHPNSRRQPVHTRIQPAATSPTAPTPPSPSSSMEAYSSFVRQPLRTKVVLDHSQEMTEEEAKLRESALVFTVSGSCPRLTLSALKDGLLQDFPELPLGSFHVSLMHPGTFFVRFSEPQWFQLVAAQPVFHCNGTPVLIRKWNRLTFASFSKYRFSVRLFIERLTQQAWSFTTVQRALSSCLIHTIAEETLAKADLSYYVIDAWVDKLEDVPTEVTIDIHEPRPCIDLLAHVLLPPGFSSPDPPAPGAGTPFSSCHQEYLTTVPPRVLSTTALVHLDTSLFIRPAPESRRRWTSRDDDDFYDNDDVTRTEESIHSWTHGIPDNAWHRTLEAASSGAAAGQHRPSGRRGSGGRRRGLLPAGLSDVPLPLAWGSSGGGASVDMGPTPGPGATYVDQATNKDNDDITGADSTTLGIVPPANSGRVNGAAPSPEDFLNGQVLPTSGSGTTDEDLSTLAFPEPRGTGTQEPQALEVAADVDNCLLPATALLPHADLPQVGHDEPVAAAAGPTSTVADVLPTAIRREEHGPFQAGPVEADAAPTPLDSLLGRVCGPISPPLLTAPAPAPPRRPRKRRSPATATRRSHRVQAKCAKKSMTGGGSNTMRLASRLIISKKGLAIAEPEDEEEEEALEEYTTAFDTPLTEGKIEALSALAKAAHGKKTRRPGRVA